MIMIEMRAKESPLAGALAGATRAFTRAIASIGKSGISGTMAGMAEEVSGYPLDSMIISQLND
jgi:hypothetical protein